MVLKHKAAGIIGQYEAVFAAEADDFVVIADGKKVLYAF
jgi:hypothetical protein